jgi:parvulin-like peptidyl-prolyl isomerase
MKTWGFLLWGWILVTAAFRSGQAQDVVLVEGPGVHLTFEEYREAYVDYLLRTGQSDSPYLRLQFVDQLVAEALVVSEARQQGIEADPAYQEEAAVLETKLLVEAYARQVLYDTVQVHEAELAEAFVRLNTQLRARYLLAPTRAAAESLRARLLAGESFEVLAREVFRDTLLAHRGGDVGWFSFDDMDPAFEDAAFSLKVGEISPPVQTAYGYALIQVTDRFQKPVLTETEFARKRPLLERYLRYRKQQASREACARNLADSLAIRFDPATLRRLYDRITGRVEQSGEALHADLLQAPLLTFGPEGRRTTWTVADFRAQAQRTSRAQREAAARSIEALQEFARGLVVRHLLAQRARDAGLDRTPAFRAALQKALDRWVYHYVKQQALAQVKVPEDTLRTYYTTHQEYFQLPARRAVWEILVSTEAEANRLKAALDTVAFSELARRYSKRPGAAATGGYLGYVTQAQLGPIGATVFAAAQEGEVVGPLPIPAGYVLLQVGGWAPEQPMAFEEARPQIEALLRPEFARWHWQQYLEQVRARYADKLTWKTDFRLEAAALRTP